MAPEEDAEPGCSLDVTSESFDPLLALYSPCTPLPFPNVRCFNNLAEYESFMRGAGRARARPQGEPKPRKKGRKPAPDPERVERLKKLMKPVAEDDEAERKTAPRRGRRPPRNVLTRMAWLEGSPVGRLYRCIQERLKVNVHIRTFKGLRGVCSGFIVAFDKFWNMAMVDVDETYRKPVLGDAFHHEPKLTLTRLFDKLKLQESGDKSSTEAQSSASHGLELPPPSTSSQHRRGKDRTPSSSQERKKDKKVPQQPGHGTREQTQQEVIPKQWTRRRKEKIDYQQVFTRHMKQVHGGPASRGLLPACPLSSLQSSCRSYWYNRIACDSNTSQLADSHLLRS